MTSTYITHILNDVSNFICISDCKGIKGSSYKTRNICKWIFISIPNTFLQLFTNVCKEIIETIRYFFQDSYR